jgi:autotransporter-associated beta strand protein
VLSLGGANTTGVNTFGGDISDNPNAAIGNTRLTTAFNSGATSITLASVQGLSLGASISGTGIAGGTTITAIDTVTNVVTLSTATTGSGSIQNVITADGVRNPLSISKVEAGTWVLGGNNTYTGNTTVSAGTLELADNASLRFAIGDNGLNNGINGSGTLNLYGDFVFDLTGADNTIGNSWNIVNVATLSETFGGTFQVFSTLGSFSEASGVWSKIENGVKFEFAQSTGLLTTSVIPEPSTALAGILLGLGLLRRRRSA